MTAVSGAVSENKLKRVARAVRAWEPLNAVFCSACRAVLGHPKWAVAHLPRVGTVRTRLPNNAELRLWSRGDDWVTNQVYWYGWDAHEPETARLFWVLARSSRLVVDIGAHIGYFTLLAALADIGRPVHAFEPEPSARSRLLHHLELNNIRNVRVDIRAVSDSDGTEAFFMPMTATGIQSSATMIRSVAESGSTPSANSTVTTVKLDTVFGGQGQKPDLIKMDIEGAECRALRGMSCILDENRPVIVSEVIESFGGTRALWDELRIHRYATYWITDEGLISRPFEASREWRNQLFVPVERTSEVLNRATAAVRQLYPRTRSTGVPKPAEQD